MAVLKFWDGSQWQSIGAGAAWSPGDLKMTFLSTADEGWLICDGSLVSTTTYAALFEAIGHSANAGNDPGGGNFKLPDLRQRFPMGKAASGLGATLGGTGGSNDAVVVSHNHTQNAHDHPQDAHAHTQNSHGHSVNDPGHEHAIDGDYGNRVLVSAGAGVDRTNNGAGGTQVPYSISDIDANSTGISVNGSTPTINPNTADNQPATATNQAAGVSATNANVPAFQAVNYMIKW